MVYAYTVTYYYNVFAALTIGNVGNKHIESEEVLLQKLNAELFASSKEIKEEVLKKVQELKSALNEGKDEEESKQIGFGE